MYRQSQPFINLAVVSSAVKDIQRDRRPFRFNESCFFCMEAKWERSPPATCESRLDMTWKVLHSSECGAPLTATSCHWWYILVLLCFWYRLSPPLFLMWWKVFFFTPLERSKPEKKHFHAAKRREIRHEEKRADFSVFSAFPVMADLASVQTV